MKRLIESLKKHEILLAKILLGRSDADIDFIELCDLLKYLGFEERIRGSHHVFRKHRIIEKLNLQREGSKAKVYQVKQVRNLFLKYGIGEAYNG